MVVCERMARGPAEQLAIESRRSQVAGLFLQGVRRQGELAQRLGVERSTISRDLKVLHARWKEAAVRDLDAAKGQELERIDRLEREYWDAWQASQNERQTSTTEQTTDDDGQRLKASLRKVAQTGDPRYLEGVRWCIQKRCELLGLDDPRTALPRREDSCHVRIDVFQQVQHYAALFRERPPEPGLLPGPVRGDGAQQPLDQAPADDEAG
jgi:hypothetical protein